MIGVRRLELNPNAHIFDLQFRVTGAKLDFAFTKGTWRNHGEKKYNGKLLPFEPGEYEFGPIITEEFNSTDGNSFKYDERTDFEYCAVNSYAYRVRYEYKVLGSNSYSIKTSNMSDSKKSFPMCRINKKSYSVIEDNEMTEIIHKITSDNCGIIDDVSFHFTYDSNKCNLKLFVPDIKTDPAYFGIEHSTNFSNKPNILDNNILELLKFLNQEITIGELL